MAGFLLFGMQKFISLVRRRKPHRILPELRFLNGFVMFNAKGRGGAKESFLYIGIKTVPVFVNKANYLPYQRFFL